MRVGLGFLLTTRSMLEGKGGAPEFCISAMIPTVENDFMVFT